MKTKRKYIRRCGALFWQTLGERICGKPAAYLFDKGKRGGYAVCEECAATHHPKRLTRIVEVQNEAPAETEGKA